MNCFMFPGQPFSDCPALQADAEWRQIEELVRQHGHFDLMSSTWVGVQGTDQIGLQLQGLAQGLYQLRRLRGHGVWADVVAQHSMGIYPALVACGCLPEALAIELTWRVGSCLARMGMLQHYALGSVTGLHLDQVQALADNNQVYVANHNTSRHFLLSGTKTQMEQAISEAQRTGAFSARCFDCDAPLHTPLVQQMEGELEEIFDGYCFKDPALPLMNHLNQNYLSAADIPWFLLRELQLPVYWERTYRALLGAGVARFYEVSEGESLRKFNRWIDVEMDKPVRW